MNNPYTRFVGIDLGSEFHQICVVEPTGNIICERKVEHGGAGIQQMLAWLTELPGAVSPETVAVALEAPRGAVVDALLERGYAVFSIIPNRWIGSAIVIRWPGPRTMPGMPTFKPTLCVPICRISAASVQTTSRSSACAN